MKNLNELAVAVSKLDAGFEQSDIAQIKRVLRCMAKILSEDSSAVAYLIGSGIKQKKKGKK